MEFYILKQAKTYFTPDKLYLVSKINPTDFQNLSGLMASIKS
jgi:hypothetical protein